MRRASFAAATCAVALWHAPALSGTFTVTPVRIYMQPRERAVAITVTNDGDEPIVLQADIGTWSQTSDGHDEVVPTEDLILAPPILKLPANGRQVVRLALLKPADPRRQMIYRLVIREVPEAKQPKPGLNLPIALALSLPVFITPPQAQPRVACTVGRQAQVMAATCTNMGSAYAQVRELTVSRAGKVIARFEGGSYVLPGARQQIPLKSEAEIPAGPAQLSIATDDGKTQAFDITVP